MSCQMTSAQPSDVPLFLPPTCIPIHMHHRMVCQGGAVVPPLNWGSGRLHWCKNEDKGQNPLVCI